MTLLGRRRSTINLAATLVGAAFLAVGVLGFIPGITTHYGQMEFAGHTSDAKLLGVFEVSILHNVVHILFGIAGLAAGRSTSLSAQRFLIGGGVVYLVLWVYGLAVGNEATANFVPVNSADNWLHLVLGAGMIVLGVTLGQVTKRKLRI
jgi:arginine exporter protein ArgO